MIIGLGCDVITVGRIAEQLEKSGSRFQKKCFTENEIKAAEKYTDEQKIINHFAKRFAAKEAFAKALGSGFGEYLSFTDVGVENDGSGKPILVVSDKAADLLKKLASDKIPVCHVSLSDDEPYAVAVVIIEAID